MKICRHTRLCLALSFSVAVSGCSSDNTGGATGADGGSSSSGGAAASGGGPGTGGQNAGGLDGAGGGTAAGAGGTAADAGRMATGGAGTAGSFTLTSGAYADGTTIPAVHTCAGANTSPPLTWSAGPAGTKSYTLIFTDKTNKLVHWALWDVPLEPTSLPAALAAGMPAGSHGASIAGNGGYGGPCPSGSLHTYQFDLYAVDVDKLPINANSMQAAVVTSAMAHKLAVASLSGTSNAKRP